LTTLILQHDDCLAHDPGAGHLESSARLRAVLGALKDIAGTETLPAPLASQEQVLRVHGEEYWARVVAAEPASGQVALDADTVLSPGSINAALRGSGAACFAVDQIFAGKAKNAFCVTRPPGHHAEADLAMGFCLLNHVAVAARHALAVHPVQRVAIVDFDVHHGNGTQSIFEQSPEVFFASSHQMPLYPGTGYPDEVGCGNILNMPLQARSGGKEFRSAWTQLGLPALHAFAPDLILVSAGFDAYAGDPLGQLKLKDSDFAWITAAICDYAEAACNGRVISVLEGGYNLEALARAARAHAATLAQAVRGRS
jgi:acetoin utilization deacetylase AcuC-like enzyme